MVQYDTIWYSMVQYGSVWYNMVQVSDQASANMESESYQELSAASLRWQSNAIPISAIGLLPSPDMLNSFEQFAEEVTHHGYTRRQELLHDGSTWGGRL